MTSLSSFSIMIQKDLASALSKDYLNNFILRQIGTHVNAQDIENSLFLPFFNEELSQILPVLLENDFHYRDAEKLLQIDRFAVKKVKFLESISFCKQQRIFKILDSGSDIFTFEKGFFRFIQIKSNFISAKNVLILHDFHQSPVDMLQVSQAIRVKHGDNCNIIIPFIHQMVENSSSNVFTDLLRLLKKLVIQCFNSQQFVIIGQGLMANIAITLSKMTLVKKTILVSPILNINVILKREVRKKLAKVDRISFIDEYSMQSDQSAGDYENNYQHKEVQSNEVSGEILEINDRCAQPQLQYQVIKQKFILVKTQDQVNKEINHIKSNQLSLPKSFFKDSIVNLTDLRQIQDNINTQKQKSDILIYTRAFNNMLSYIYSNKQIKTKICKYFKVKDIFNDNCECQIKNILGQFSQTSLLKKRKLLSKYIIQFNVFSQIKHLENISQNVQLYDDNYFNSILMFQQLLSESPSTISSQSICEILISPNDQLLTYKCLEILKNMQPLNKVQIRTILGVGHDILNATVNSVANLVFG